MDSKMKCVNQAIWYPTCVFPFQGTCQDDISVKSSHTFNTVEYHEERVKTLENILTQLRTHIHGTYALVTYTAQLSRLQIECYIHHLLSRSSLFCDVDDTMPITGKKCHFVYTCYTLLKPKRH